MAPKRPLTSEELEERRRRHAAAQRRWQAAITDAERECLLQQALEERRRRHAATQRRWYAARTDAERERLLQQKREAERRRLSGMDEEQLARRKQLQRERYHARIHNMSAEQNQRRSANIHAVKQEPRQSPTTSAGEFGDSSETLPKAEITKKPRHHCGVVGCTKPTKPLHRIPQNLELRRMWLERIGLLESETRTFLFVCQRHFAADAYTLNPDLLKDMGFTTRYYLRADAVPSLFLPSDPKQEALQETLQRQTTAETQSQAPLRQYRRLRPKGTMSTQTQTAPYQRTVRAQASPLPKGKDSGMQVDLDFGVSAGTQTDVLPVVTCTTQNTEQKAASPSDQTCDCSCHRVCHCSCQKRAVNTIATQTITIGSMVSMWTS